MTSPKEGRRIADDPYDERTVLSESVPDVDLDQTSLGVRLNEISALRRTRFEVWPLGLSDSCFVSIVTLCSGSCALRESQSRITRLRAQGRSRRGCWQNLTP
jgi:hypothetical protein